MRKPHSTKPTAAEISTAIRMALQARGKALARPPIREPGPDETPLSEDEVKYAIHRGLASRPRRLH
jgi:hypothetical protein